MTQENEHPVDTEKLEREYALDIESSTNEVRCHKVEKRYSGPRIFIDGVDQHITKKTSWRIDILYRVEPPCIITINGVVTEAYRAIHSIRRRREVYEFFTAEYVIANGITVDMPY